MLTLALNDWLKKNVLKSDDKIGPNEEVKTKVLIYAFTRDHLR